MKLNNATFPQISEECSPHLPLHPICPKFPYIRGKMSKAFIRVFGNPPNILHIHLFIHIYMTPKVRERSLYSRSMLLVPGTMCPLIRPEIVRQQDQLGPLPQF